MTMEKFQFVLDCVFSFLFGIVFASLFITAAMDLIVPIILMYLVLFLREKFGAEEDF